MKKKNKFLLMVVLIIVVLIATLLFLNAKKYVVMNTTVGSIKIELYPQYAPQTVDNFIFLVESGYFNNKIFHRVIEDFMIQAGGITKDGISDDVGYFIPDEINPISLGLSKDEILALEARGYRFTVDLQSIPLERGVLGMANRGPATSNCQFFIVTAQEGTPWLNGRHTAFGKVIKGMEVVDEISRQETNEGHRPIRRMIIRRSYTTRWPW